MELVLSLGCCHRAAEGSSPRLDLAGGVLCSGVCYLGTYPGLFDSWGEALMENAQIAVTGMMLRPQLYLSLVLVEMLPVTLLGLPPGV